MGCVKLEASVPDAQADAVFERIRDFPRYAEHTNAVREIRIDHSEDGMTTSTWSVNFRNGVLQWRERDRIDLAARRITFEQLDGDFAGFTGSWVVTERDGGAGVTFEAEFDLGMPTLEAIIEPIAETTLVDNVQAIIRGLLGDEVRFPEVADEVVSGTTG